MTTALTKTQRNDVLTLLKNNAKAIQSVLPQHLKPEKMLRMAYQCIEVTPKLALCSQASFFNAILELAGLGLEPGSPLGLAHLIPFGQEVKVIIDYKGYIQLANNANVRVVFHPVYEEDEFSYQYGIGGYLNHKPANNDRGKLIYAYAIAYFPSGPPDFEVVDKKIAMSAKARSAAKDKSDSPWNKVVNGERVDEAIMWCKTAVRRLFKRIPSSPELQRAALYDEYQEAGIPQNIPNRLVKDDGSIIDLQDFEIVNEKDLTGAIKGEKPSQDSKKGSSVKNKDKGKAETGEKAWPNKAAFIADIKSYEHEDLLGKSQFADILASHEVDPGEIHRLNKEQGLALWQDLEKAREGQ